jgi:hypothetical protein
MECLYCGSNFDKENELNTHSKSCLIKELKIKHEADLQEEKRVFFSILESTLITMRQNEERYKEELRKQQQYHNEKLKEVIERFDEILSHQVNSFTNERNKRIKELLELARETLPE